MKFWAALQTSCLFALLGLITLSTRSISAQTYSQFNNGSLTEHPAWLDRTGNIINAHDGGILFADGKYHWYGMPLRPLPVSKGLESGQKTTIGVVMYSSKDLYNWDYEGVVLPTSNDPASPLRAPMRFERPKIIYNKSTKQYVMWFHYVGYPGDHTNVMGGGEAGVAVSSSITGPYVFKGYSRPIDDRGIVRDSTLFQDDDGSAYFIYDRDIREPGPDFSRVLHIVKLTPDYLGFTREFYKIANASRREAPVMFKRNGFYFLITSAETGWDNNAANYYRATNVMGPYTEMPNPAIGPAADTTFNAQGTYPVPIQGHPDELLFLAERHITSRMTDSSYIFLPIQFPTPSTLELHYISTWRWNEWPR